MHVWWLESHGFSMQRRAVRVYRSGLANPYGVAIDLPNAM